MAKKNITLQEFIKKAQDKVKNKKMVIDVDVPSMDCKITVTRPEEDELLQYLSDVTKAIKADKAGNVLDTDIKQMYDASKVLIYSNCAYLKDQELHEALEIKEPLDIIPKLFQHEEVIEIAQDIYSQFADKEVIDNVKK